MTTRAEIVRREARAILRHAQVRRILNDALEEAGEPPLPLSPDARAILEIADRKRRERGERD
jgi:hypothetical protein